MRRLFARIAIALPTWLMLGGISAAMCMWFVPPSRQFEPATNMKTLISREGNEVSMTVQPQFSGDARDFALVMPFPSEPTVVDAPKNIFQQLEDLTNPLTDFVEPLPVIADTSVSESAGSRGVEVIEERDVGDFAAVTLRADDETALVKWLKDEGYEVTDRKLDIISSYVGDGAYFVALKVNMERANVDKNGDLDGELNPIRFNFTSSSVVLPTSLMAGDGALVSLTVYAIGEYINYIPGAEIQYSNKVSAEDMQEAPGLESYNAWQRWLVRNSFQLDTALISQDLTLFTTSEKRVVVPGEVPIVLNPELLAQGTGLIESNNGEIIYTDEDDKERYILVKEDNFFALIAILTLIATNLVLIVVLMSEKYRLSAEKKPTAKR